MLLSVCQFIPIIEWALIEFLFTAAIPLCQIVHVTPTRVNFLRVPCALQLFFCRCPPVFWLRGNVPLGTCFGCVT